MKNISRIIMVLAVGLGFAGCEYYNENPAYSPASQTGASSHRVQEEERPAPIDQSEITAPEADDPAVEEAPSEEEIAAPANGGEETPAADADGNETLEDHETEESDPEPTDGNLSSRVLEMIHRGERIRSRDKSGHIECVGPLAEPRSGRLDPDCTRVRVELPPQRSLPQR